jgi:hypothetical protein
VLAAPSRSRPLTPAGSAVTAKLSNSRRLPVAAFVVGGALLTLQFAPAFQEPMAEPTLEDPYQPGVVDERSYYDGTTSLLTATRTRVMPSHRWANEGRRVRAEQKASVVTGHMGLLGFFAGRKPHIIDYHALTDAFLAHVPPMRNSRWIIGHWKRVVPSGYVESALSGRCQMQDPNVCVFFERMHLVIAGPLLSWERLVTIARMNAGAYAPLVNIELFRLPELAREPIEALAEPVRDGALAKGKTEPAGTRAISESGLDVRLNAPSQRGAIELALDSDDDYGLEFFRGERSLGRVVVRANFGGGMRNRHVAVPEGACRAGYDRIRIQPDRGDGKYRAGHVRLLD